MDMFVFINTIYAVTFLHLRRGQTGFSWSYDNSYTSFFIFILPLLMELFFLVDKIPLVLTMTLRFKAAVNMEDKHTLNLDKFHVCVKLLLSCPGIYLRTNWQGLNYKVLNYRVFIFLLFSYLC